MQDIRNSRSEEMKRRMLLLHEKGLCLFCEDGFHLMEKIKLFEGKGWYVTLNDEKYKGAVNHLMAVPTRHIKHPSDLTPDERNELFDTVIPWLEKVYGMQGISGVFRFGKTERTGATIHHLHFHFIEGVDRVTQDQEPIFAVVGFKPTTPQSTQKEPS